MITQQHIHSTNRPERPVSFFQITPLVYVKGLGRPVLAYASGEPFGASMDYKNLPINRDKNPLMLDWRLVLSEEYKSLNGTAKNVYHVFLYKRRIKGKSGKKRVINNCAIKFTQEEAVHRWKFSLSGFKRAIKQLKDKGMIRVAHKGYGANHDCSLYELNGRFDGIAKFK